MSLLTEMKIQKIIILNEAIRELVHIDKSKGVKLSGATRMKLAANLRILSNHVQDFQLSRDELITGLGTKVDGKDAFYEVKRDSENYPEFEAQIKAMTEVERSVKLDALTKSDLFGSSNDPEKQNQVPIDIISTFLEYGLLMD